MAIIKQKQKQILTKIRIQIIRSLTGFLVIFSFFSVALCLAGVNVHAAQKSYDYKLPFRWNEVWDSNILPGRDNYGVHADSTGFAFDFYAPSGSSMDVLAPASGVISRGCTVGNATYLTLTADSGDKFRLIHLKADSVPVQTGQTARVNQGDYLGDIYGKGSFDAVNCSLSTDGPHVHFSWQAASCPFSIEGYTFDCSGMRTCVDVYTVPCNKKEVNRTFLSTNGINLSNSDCNDLLNRNNWAIGQENNDVQRMQICLKKKGLYGWGGGYTGYLGDYTMARLNEWRLKNPTNSFVVTPGGRASIALLSNSNLALTTTSLSNGSVTEISMKQDTKIETQTWERDNSTMEVKLTSTGQCLDATYWQTFNTNRAIASVIINSCTGSQNQKWDLTSKGELVNRSNNYCLNVWLDNRNDGGKLVTHSCSGLPQENEKFNFNKLSTPIKLSSNGGLVVGSMNSNLGAETLLRNYAGANNREHNWTYNQNTGELKNLSGLCLDATYWQTFNTNRAIASVIINSCTGSQNQKWNFSNRGEIINRSNNYCLNVWLNNRNENARIVTHPCSGTPQENEKFVF